MKKIKDYLGKIDIWLYVILFFCVIGFLRNAWQLVRFGFDYSSIATKVFVTMFIIYLAQSVLILMRERKAWIISAIQVFFCFYVFEDFTFVPLSNIVRMIVDSFAPNIDYGYSYFMNTVLISGLFCLELLKTYIIYILTQDPAPSEDKKEPVAQKQEPAA